MKQISEVSWEVPQKKDIVLYILINELTTLSVSLEYVKRVPETNTGGERKIYRARILNDHCSNQNSNTIGSIL